MWFAWAGGAAGALIAAASVAMFLLDPARFTADLRDFGLLIGFEVAALSFALASLIRTASKAKTKPPQTPFVF